LVLDWALLTIHGKSPFAVLVQALLTAAAHQADDGRADVPAIERAVVVHVSSERVTIGVLLLVGGETKKPPYGHVCPARRALTNP